MSFRKTVFWIHLAIGCVAGAVILIMSVTGVLLMYQRQIITWFDRDFRSISRQAGAVRLPVETMLAGICSQKGSMPSAITLRAAADAPAEVSFGREHVFFVDTYGQRPRGGVAENPVVLSNSGRLASMAGGERPTSGRRPGRDGRL